MSGWRSVRAVAWGGVAVQAAVALLVARNAWSEEMVLDSGASAGALLVVFAAPALLAAIGLVRVDACILGAAVATTILAAFTPSAHTPWLFAVAAAYVVCYGVLRRTSEIRKPAFIVTFMPLLLMAWPFGLSATSDPRCWTAPDGSAVGVATACSSDVTTWLEASAATALTLLVVAATSRSADRRTTQGAAGAESLAPRGATP